MESIPAVAPICAPAKSTQHAIVQSKRIMLILATANLVTEGKGQGPNSWQKLLVDGLAGAGQSS